MPQISKRKQQLLAVRGKRRRISAATAEPAAERQSGLATDIESEIESDLEYEPILIPDDPGEKPSMDTAVNKSSWGLKGCGGTTHFKYQRGAVPSRQTQWRIAKEKNALRAAATGSVDITSRFATQSTEKARKLAIPPPLTSSKIRDEAIHQLQLKLGRTQRTQFFHSLNGQTRVRYEAVLRFLYAWRLREETSRKMIALDVAHSFNRGAPFARSILQWEKSWVTHREIPEGRTGAHPKVTSLFNDEEVKLFVMEYIASHKESITAGSLANAVTEYMGFRSVGEKTRQAILNGENQQQDKSRQSIRVSAARAWLKSMGYTWRTPKKDVYLDGHERPDVVNDRQEFLAKFKQFEPRLARWDENGNLEGGEAPPDAGRWLVIVTHDESTFQVNDGRRHIWLQEGGDPLRPKGLGRGIMVSDFLTPNGRLAVPEDIRDDILATLNLPREAAIMLEYGKGDYWTGEKMAAQTLEVALPIFELAFPSNKFQGLFLFDNATNHRMLADDALDARKMNLKPGGKQSKMRPTQNPETKEPQEMMCPDGTPKGIQQVLLERGKWPETGLRLECKSASEHRDDNSCCARRVLAAEPDFRAQCGLIQEHIEARGHLVMFYPKFHPELNFIEYFWGACKRYAREHCQHTLAGLRTTVPQALEAVPVTTIRKFHRRTLRIMDTYREGVALGSKEYKEKVYRSHRRIRLA